ncbi:MAG: hypothetical protein JRN08_09740 [Nitrososphaerota archaeon]|nr:hypothetical protein [Nitrososphaerota archaeon]
MAAYDKVNGAPGMEWINSGVTALKGEALDGVERGRVCDEPAFYGGLVKDGQLRAFEVAERFCEIGSERSLDEFRSFISGPPEGEAHKTEKPATGLRRSQARPKDEQRT